MLETFFVGISNSQKFRQKFKPLKLIYSKADQKQEYHSMLGNNNEIKLIISASIKLDKHDNA